MSQAGEDLFEGTKMSFGQHLEELRIHLFRAVLGLAVGMILTLVIADRIVEVIKSPLSSALERYYSKSAELKLNEEYGEGNVPDELKKFVINQRFTFDEYYLERSEIERIAKEGQKEPQPELARLQKEMKKAVDANDDSKVAKLQTELDAYFANLVDKQLASPNADLVKTRMWKPAVGDIVALGAQESFMIWLKAGFMAGLIVSSPWIFWQIWQFVAAGLYPHERRYVHIYLPFSLGLFIAGALLAFMFVFEPVLDFLFGFNRMMNIDPDPRISEWISFVLFLPIGFGIAFQLPLVMLFINRIGIISIEMYLEKWRIAVLIIFVLSMLLTPADPISMLLMAVPLTFLYFFGVLLCKYMPKGQSPFEEPYDPS